jgi:hypothetical protein
VNTNNSYAMTVPHVAEINNGHVVITWTAANQIKIKDTFVQIFYENEGICNDVQIQLVNQQAIQVNFSTNPYEDIILKTFPANGQLKDDTQKSLSINNFIDKTKVFYVTTAQKPDSFTFSTNTAGPSCKVTITVCYQTCLTCTQIGDATNNSCLQCASNLYKMSDNRNNCYSSTDIPHDGYYLDTITNTFLKCYLSCLTCAIGGDSGNNNCLSCAKNYYNLEDKLSQCYLNTDAVVGYFFNIINANFTKCFNSCDTCKLLGNISQHLCSKCKNNFFPLEEDASMCYFKDSFVPGYYLDFPNSIFKKCYKSCSQCSGPGDIFTTNCTQCAPNYTVCSDCTTMVYKDSCVDSCPPLTVYDATFKTCIDCNAGEVVLNGQCTSECPVGYVLNSTTCVTCIKLNMYNYKTTCVVQCPEGSVLNATTNTCDINCGLGYYVSDFSCLTCQSNNKLVFEGICVDKCPVRYIQNNEGICILTKTYSYNTTCTSPFCKEECITNICENGGNCSIQYEKTTCTCSSTFIGQYCQIVSGNVEKIRPIISKIIITI